MTRARRASRWLAAGGLIVSAIATAGDLNWNANVQTRYESNVWLFSDRERRDFRTDPDSASFRRVESLDDFSLSPALAMSWRLREDWRYRLIGSAERFVRNDVLDSEELFMDLRHNLNRRSHLRASVSYSPQSFVGETRRGTVSAREEFVSNRALGLTFAYRLDKRNRVLLQGLLARDDYTRGFDDQDSRLYTLRARWRHRLDSRWSLDTSVWFRRRDSDQLTGPDGQVVFNDISSDSYRIDGGARYRIDRATAVAARVIYLRKRYTTDSVADDNHFGRVDRSYGVAVRLSRRLTDAWGNHWRVRYQEKNSSLAGRFEYQTWSISVGFGYAF